MLLSASEFGVNQFAAFEVIEADAVLQFARLGHKFFLFGDPQVADGGLGQVAGGNEVMLGLFAKCQPGGVEGRAAKMGGRYLLPFARLRPLAAFAEFGFVGDTAFPAAVVAKELTIVQIDGKGFVTLVMAGFCAVGASGFDVAGSASVDVDAEGMEISHCSVFDGVFFRQKNKRTYFRLMRALFSSRGRIFSVPRGEVVPSRETDFVTSRGRFAPKPGKNPLLRPVVPDSIVFRAGRCFVGDGATHVGALPADTLLEAVRVE